MANLKRAWNKRLGGAAGALRDQPVGGGRSWERGPGGPGGSCLGCLGMSELESAAAAGRNHVPQ